MKIICIGHNYGEHIQEMGNTTPGEPLFFLKPDSCLLRTGRNFYLPAFTHDLQYELEVVFRICRLGKHIDRRFAHRYYDKVGLGIDFTARDLQRKCQHEGLPWEMSKCFDGSAAISTLVDKNALPDVKKLHFTLFKNDVQVQQGNTADMLFDIDEIVEHVSRFMTLKTGDLIYTGTPAGVGNPAEGDTLTGFLESEKLLKINIK